jgi:rhamnosyltransferase
MRLTQGECVALLSQDATPATDGWLKALLDPLKDQKTAGSFSRHIPRPESTPLVKRQVFEFDLCGTETSRINELRPGEEGFLRRACFFANSSSCIKRSVWIQHPFSRIDFAEDQEWSLRVLRAGYRTAYAGDSAVFHSHDYPLGSLFMRHFEHAQAMRAIFGTQEIPDLSGLRRGLLEHLKADWRFLNAQPCSSLFVLKWMCLALPWHWVRFWGLWLGSRSDQLPGWLSDRLSLQKRLAKKGTA